MSGSAENPKYEGVGDRKIDVENILKQVIAAGATVEEVAPTRKPSGDPTHLDRHPVPKVRDQSGQVTPPHEKKPQGTVENQRVVYSSEKEDTRNTKPPGCIGPVEGVIACSLALGIAVTATSIWDTLFPPRTDTSPAPTRPPISAPEIQSPYRDNITTEPPPTQSAAPTADPMAQSDRTVPNPASDGEKEGDKQISIADTNPAQLAKDNATIFRLGMEVLMAQGGNFSTRVCTRDLNKNAQLYDSCALGASTNAEDWYQKQPAELVYFNPKNLRFTAPVSDKYLIRHSRTRNGQEVHLSWTIYTDILGNQTAYVILDTQINGKHMLMPVEQWILWQERQ